MTLVQIKNILRTTKGLTFDFKTFCTIEETNLKRDSCQILLYLVSNCLCGHWDQSRTMLLIFHLGKT